ncbi:MAG: hypothetical protein CMN04_08920, partial [Roseibacillus sp.]|nr:hypothetical protein [Roseibacillus sp.]
MFLGELDELPHLFLNLRCIDPALSLGELLLGGVSSCWRPGSFRFGSDLLGSFLRRFLGCLLGGFLGDLLGGFLGDLLGGFLG